jgi:hypothetical protein
MVSPPYSTAEYILTMMNLKLLAAGALLVSPNFLSAFLPLSNVAA